MLEPAVSIFIPTFNRLPCLKKAVQSVLSQGDFIQLHVLDNASTDGTSAWLHELRNNNPRVRLTLRTTNVGATKNFIDGFEAVQTPYLVPLADDDELAPGFIDAAWAIAKADQDLGAVIFITDSRANGETLELSPANAVPGRREPEAHLLEWAKNGHYTSWSSILWRTGAIRQLALSGEFERFGLPGDVWIQFLIFSIYPVYLQDKIGSFFTQHPEQASKMASLEVISDFGRMTSEMGKILLETQVLEGSQQEFFLNQMCCHACGYFSFLSDRTSLPRNDAELGKSIEAYLQYFAPFIGFTKFPLLPAFEQYRAAQRSLSELKVGAEEVKHLRSSLSWRVMERLFVVEQALKQLPSRCKDIFRRGA